VQRGEIWLVNLDPTVGSEIQKTRPCLIISPPELHDHLRTVIVAPLTSQGFNAPFRVPLRHADKDGLILLDQIRTIDKLRLAKKLGAAPASVLAAVLRVLQEVFAA
jgi:mRNA interferase MazF